MPDRTVRKKSVPQKERGPRTDLLPSYKMRAAKRALGAATATEVTARTLVLAAFQRELVHGTRAMLGVDIGAPDNGS